MKRFTIIILLLAVLAHPVSAMTYVVCVGISDYPGTVNDLRVSDNDAQTIYNIFNKNGRASTCYYTNKNATIANICSAMRSYFSQADEKDNIIFYFSGHGIKGGLVCYDGYLYYYTILSIMGESKARSKVIFADACFSGKMRGNLKRRNNHYSASNAMLFLSSRDNETSIERLPNQYKFHNSLFTVYLERGLRGGADVNGDRSVTAKELFNFVHTGVIHGSANHQHPVMYGKFNDNMPIIKW